MATAPAGDRRSGHRYSLYLDADLNRVFTGSLLEVAAAELRLVSDGLGRPAVSEIERIADGRSRLLRFEADGPAKSVATLVGQLSASAALFRHHRPPQDDPTADLLEPVAIAEPLVHGSDLATVQRYRGKTNERLTRAMLNVALATAGIDPARPTGTVLDPMCGRGTTLNWALAYGLDGVGIEAERGSLEQHAGFLQTWAKRQRLPHNAQRYKSNNAEQRAFSLEVGVDRATLKAGRGQRVQTFCSDGADRRLPIKRGAIDIVVADLPYGVQHRGSADGGKSASTASTGGAGGSGGPDTIELLERVLPTWHHWLRTGGAICLAWNTKRAGRRAVGRALAEAGFNPVTAAGGFSMRHVVDATIDRDVIVARR
ncbi:MAG: TRM11 family SAM-dependent methyltransferase [Acidimicrobiales bacterium]